MAVTVYMLYDPKPNHPWNGTPLENPSPDKFVFLGGGSSTPASVRVYETPERARKMRDRYFPGCEILPVELPV